MIYSFFTSKGYKMSPDTFAKAMGTVDVDPGFPTDLEPYMQHHAEVLLKEKKISAIPDWKKALRHRLHGEGARRLLSRTCTTCRQPDVAQRPDACDTLTRCAASCAFWASPPLRKRAKRAASRFSPPAGRMLMKRAKKKVAAKKTAKKKPAKAKAKAAKTAKSSP